MKYVTCSANLATLQIRFSSYVITSVEGKKGEGGERKPWVIDQACLTAVLLAARSGTDNIDFQLSAALTIARLAWT
jgi:hypothetical protein